ncbi:MAG: hypothetical protein WCJ66_07245, partial [Verrucomicrobiota bacterium]
NAGVSAVTALTTIGGVRSGAALTARTALTACTGVTAGTAVRLVRGVKAITALAADPARATVGRKALGPVVTRRGAGAWGGTARLLTAAAGRGATRSRRFGPSEIRMPSATSRSNAWRSVWPLT